MVTINSRKFDGRISKSWTAELCEQSVDLLTFKGVFEMDVDHPKLGFIHRGTVSYEFYWPDEWFNIFRFHEPSGEVRNFYCNVAMPPTYGNGELNFVDLDLDVLVEKDLKYEVLDVEEFEERSVLYVYPKEVVERAHKSVEELIGLIEGRAFPFNFSG